ncbi:MAG: hypothetical protein JRI79_16710 [Deltaproteobacteria bacterium]|nr:hypothetical protein [Deltaproteobacteria bacterium]
MMGSLLGSLLAAALAPPSSNPPTTVPKRHSYQDQKKRQERARKHREGLARWKRLQEEQAAQTEREKAMRKKAASELLAQLDTVGSSGDLELQPLGDTETDPLEKHLKKELEPLSNGRYDTSYLSPINFVYARYLQRQAEHVLTGKMTDLPCQFDGAPEPPPPPAPEKAKVTPGPYEEMLQNFSQQIKILSNIEVKLRHVQRTKEEARKKMQEAEKSISEIRKRSAVGKKPQGKQEDDEMEKAQALLRQAQDQLQQANHSEEELLKKKKEIETNFRKMQSHLEARKKGKGNY